MVLAGSCYDRTNLTQGIFLTVRFYQSPLRSLMSQNAPPKIILTLLSRTGRQLFFYWRENYFGLQYTAGLRLRWTGSDV